MRSILKQSPSNSRIETMNLFLLPFKKGTRTRSRQCGAAFIESLLLLGLLTLLVSASIRFFGSSISTKVACVNEKLVEVGEPTQGKKAGIAGISAGGGSCGTTNTKEGAGSSDDIKDGIELGLETE